MIKSGVTITKDALVSTLASIKKLTGQEVLVGIPDANAERYEDLKAKGDKIVATNAMIGFWMEYGVPSRNIPARPFLIPGVQNAQPKVLGQFKKAAEAATRGDADELDVRLHSAGLIAQNEVRAVINSGPPPPLSDSTLLARAERGRKGALEELSNRIFVPGYVPGTDLAKPLIDSGQLRNSITYVIKKK